MGAFESSSWRCQTKALGTEVWNLEGRFELRLRIWTLSYLGEMHSHAEEEGGWGERGPEPGQPWHEMSFRAGTASKSRKTNSSKISVFPKRRNFPSGLVGKIFIFE